MTLDWLRVLLFKKQDKRVRCNNRKITLVILPEKVYTRVVGKRVSDWLIDHLTDYVGPTFAKTALTNRGMDSTGPLKVCYGMWCQDECSRSLKVGPPWIGLVCQAHSTDFNPIENQSLEFGGQVITSNSPQTIPEPFPSCHGRLSR